MSRPLTCAVCGARGRIPFEVADESTQDLRWLCAAHSGHIDALLGRTSA